MNMSISTNNLMLELSELEALLQFEKRFLELFVLFKFLIQRIPKALG